MRSLFFVFLFFGGIFPALAASDFVWLTPAQEHRAEQLTSLFENDSLDLQYGYCANLKDGRGYTAGRAGFTTSTDEVFQVVKIYSARRPGNALARFLPRLKELADEGSAETKGLGGFPQAWKLAAEDAAFRSVQDDLVDERFRNPARDHARKLGLRTPLAQAAIFDTIIQHGDDGDPDSLSSLLEKTRRQVGGTPATGVDEPVWLEAFLKVRRAALAHSADPESRREWAESVGRCDVFLLLARQGNYALAGPLRIKTDDFDVVIP